MSHIIEYQETRQLPAESQQSMDDNIWRAWMEKNLVQERQGIAARAKVVKCACIGVLLIAAAVSSSVLPPYLFAYQALVRFAIALGAIVVILQSLRARQYVLTALFAAIVLIFNPVFPTFAFSGHSAILFASVLPFVASLLWMRRVSQSAVLPVASRGQPVGRSCRPRSVTHCVAAVRQTGGMYAVLEQAVNADLSISWIRSRSGCGPRSDAGGCPARLNHCDRRLR